MYPNLLNRFLKYVKIETRSDENSQTVPSTSSQVAFAHMLESEMKTIGLEDVVYNQKNGYVIGTLPATSKTPQRTFGLIAHMDTADFNAENVTPHVIENYDGHSAINLDAAGKYQLAPEEFPNLKNYAGQTLITTDGRTLLGADDKAGIAEIMTAMEYLAGHPEIEHGEIRVGFGPDEEIGVGADRFDVAQFNVDFAYTIDGGVVGELEYETFSAAQAQLTIHGKNVHPGTAKGQMINALQTAIDFHNELPADARPENTAGYEGFFHLIHLSGNPEEAAMTYIIRDHDHQKFEAKKRLITDLAAKFNAHFGQKRIEIKMHDQYYNMREVIEKDMSIVELAKQAMLAVDVEPLIQPVRGGTDGSKISFMGIPTPNLFAGGENMHGRFEFVALESMEKAVDVLIKIAEMNAANG
ncbi:MAG: peptidase T [Enterococcaceae bacterium]|jgi:tripeptide aminopeptidase|nr:peptidase T [Enterococcaceae bacterium]